MVQLLTISFLTLHPEVKIILEQFLIQLRTKLIQVLTIAPILKLTGLVKHLKRSVNRDGSSTGTAGQQFGIVLGLASGSTGVVPGKGRPTLTEYNDHRFAARAAKSGWIINRDPSSDNTAYTPESAEKLFRIIALHEGKSFKTNITVRLKV